MTPVSRPAVRLPEAGRFWVRYTPRHWPAPGKDQPWTHLGEAALGPVGNPRVWSLAAEPLRSLAELPLDDVLYLAPVAPMAEEGFETLRRREARAHAERGTPVLYQLFPGQTPPDGVGTVVYDLLPVLLAARRDSANFTTLASLPALSALPAESAAVWPLIPGISDGEEIWRQGCEALASVGVAVCQPLALHLLPRQRRRLAEELDDEGAFTALFHRPAPSERGFAACAAAHGLRPFLPRPLLKRPFPLSLNRRLGEELALIGELWHRLGYTGSRGAAFYRAARWIDATTYDVAALAREGNLTVVEPLDTASREAVLECLERGESRIRRQLEEEYLQSPSRRDTIQQGGNE